MTARNVYIAVASCVAVVCVAVGSVYMWRNRVFVKQRFNLNVNKTKGMARSAWGRVEQAADRIAHTERDPQTPSAS